MEVILKPKGPQSLLPTDILFQSAFWGKVKRKLGWQTYAFNINCKKSQKDVLVLTKIIGGNTVGVFVPQGPECAPEPEAYGLFLESLSESLLAKVDGEVAFIRYDLPWESSYAREIEQNRRRDFPVNRVREMRMNFGTRQWRLKKAPKDMTVAHSCIVDIAGQEEVMLARMKSKTRYNIRLARRKGVRVKACTMEELPVLYELYRQTAHRNGFPISAYRSFEALFTVPGHQQEEVKIHLLLATHGRDVLAGAIIAICRNSAVFLYGGSADIKRNYMASYALQWEAMQYARNHHCSTYDIGAVAPGATPDHPFYGLYRFKTGFGGRIVHNVGTWDYPVKEDVYTAFKNWESTCLENQSLEMPPGVS